MTVGDAGRAPAEQLDISTMRPNNQTLSGYFLGAELLLSPRPHAMIAGHLDAIARGELKVVIDRAFPLSDAAGRPRLHREPSGLRTGAAGPLTRPVPQQKATALRP